MKQYSHNSKFDCLVRSRLLANDFAQPDHSFYKNKAILQIEASLKLIRNATSNYDFVISTAQARAFINAAYDYEFIDRIEKNSFEQSVTQAVREQTVLEV